LIPEREAVTWGTAYRVAPQDRDAVLAKLDHRERGGYAQHRTTVFASVGQREGDVSGDSKRPRDTVTPSGRAPAHVAGFASEGEALAEALVYVATHDNDNWLGDAPLIEMAAQIRQAEGPSGHNIEYVLELARALRAMGADDAHVFALATLLDPGW